ncbi:MAG: tyrosine-type recombinase/integrase [Gemmatimonadota bacterium]|nr:tyrosine-type recombinase/integrase [Gemmatimonadota bacterium]
MTDQAVMMRLRYLVEKAKVKPLTPHDLLRSFVGELLDAGADISSFQGLAGHSPTDYDIQIRQGAGGRHAPAPPNCCTCPTPDRCCWRGAIPRLRQ